MTVFRFVFFLATLPLRKLDVSSNPSTQGKDGTPYGEYGGWYKACKVNRWEDLCNAGYYLSSLRAKWEATVLINAIVNVI